MWTPLLYGSLMTLVNMGIQIFAVALLLKFYSTRKPGLNQANGILPIWKTLNVIIVFLFAGHIVQFATWAMLFMWVGEFSEFSIAFYHSTVNFASLGYGDIVMSEDWRLLGAIEACNGVLMFGLSAGMILAFLQKLDWGERLAARPGDHS